MAGRASVRTNLSTASLWIVAQSNDLAQLKELMARGVGIAARDEEGATIVHHAASAGALDILSFVVGLRRADFLNIQDKHGQTAAFRAVSSNQPKAALYLVENGADPNIKSKNGLTCITRAEAILGATYAQALAMAWESSGRAKNPETEQTPTALGGTMTKTDAKGLFQNKTDFRNPEEEARRKEQQMVDKEVDQYLRSNTDTRELTKRLALTSNPRVATALLPDFKQVSSAHIGMDEYEMPVQQLAAVPVSADNYIDLDDLADAVSEFAYVALCITLNLNLDSAAAITPKLNEALRALAEQVKRVFHALSTYAQPFVLSQRNKIISKAKGVQDSLKYCLESTKAMNATNNKETHQRLMNTTQLLVSDFCGFFFSCEQIYPETVVEQVHFSESNIGTLLQLLDKRVAAKSNNQIKTVSGDLRTTMKLIVGDSVRLNALVTARAFDKRDYEYQKQLSDACFFVTRAVKGVNLLTEKLSAGAPNAPELREKVNTLTTALSEQLSKITSILHEPIRELPPPVFDDNELAEMASRYQMAFKELNDAYLRYVEAFQHWQETRIPPRAPADPEAPIPPDFVFTERRESVTLVKVILSNIGLIKEIFARPSPLELMKTTRSLAQSLSKFAANTFRIASDCAEPALRELLMVSLQSTLLHNCHLKMITASKAMGYPLFLIEPSMLGAVRSLASILVVLLDASIESDVINQEQNVNSSTEQLYQVKLKILSFGRIICSPLAKPAPPNSRLEPLYSDPGPQVDEPPAPGYNVAPGLAALNQASSDVHLPISPLSNAVPAAALRAKEKEKERVQQHSHSERRAEDPQPTAPSAGPGSLRRDQNVAKVDGKGHLVPELAANTAPKEELGPAPSPNDQDAYKAYMIKKYEFQQRENAEILRRKKESGGN